MDWPQSNQDDRSNRDLPHTYSAVEYFARIQLGRACETTDKTGAISLAVLWFCR